MSTVMAMQSPPGVPLSTLVEPITDPLLPPQTIAAMLAHLWDEVYDKRAESHISRLLGVILGDAGVGVLRKKYLYAHLSEFILTAHFYDLDRLFADAFGIKRFVAEWLTLDPYSDLGTAAEWEAVLAADASYRSRVEQFMRAVQWGPTPNGMVLASSAIIGHEARLYETFALLDDAGAYVPPVSTPAFNTYGDLESYLYLDMESKTYYELEGTTSYHGRALDSRSEFIIRPLRPISAEERYHLIRALDRLKPAESMMTIDTNGPLVYLRVPPATAVADSVYWHVTAAVAADEAHQDLYLAYDNGDPVEQPKPVFSQRQTEEWYYNRDVVDVVSYALDEDEEIVQATDYERGVDTRNGNFVDYLPENALLDPHQIALGLAAQDGSMVASIIDRVTA